MALVQRILPSILVLPCLLPINAYADMNKRGNTNPIDPGVQGNLGPTNQPPSYRSRVNIGVGENKLVNGRGLCGDGRGLNQNETSVAVSGNVVLVAFNDSRGVCDPFHIGIVHWSCSLDGGDTWRTDVFGVPQSFNSRGDPWAGVSPDGQTFYLTSVWSPSPLLDPQGIAFYRGQVHPTRCIEWSDPVIVSFGTGFLYDKEAFAVDLNSGTIYLTYSLFDPSFNVSLYATRSSDGGGTWSEPVLIDDGPGQGTFPAVDQQGDLYVAYLAFSTSREDWQMQVSKSTDLGNSFQRMAGFPVRPLGVPFVDRSSEFPQLAVDNSGGPRDGWIYLVWHGSSPENVLRPYISHSEDGGETWSEPIAMNTDDSNAPHWWPSVSVDGTGNVNVIFLDRRNNPGTGYTDLFFAQSTDGGNTFDNFRVTDVTSSWEGIRHDPGFTYVGDYIRAISVGTTVYATWVDPRNGDPDIYFSRINAHVVADDSPPLRRRNY
jgi:hypothetical protein